jgi:predicted nucleotide-binding protein
VPNEIARVLIGASTEALKVVAEIRSGLETADADISVWEDDLLQPSRTTMEALAREARAFDFAVMVFGPEDLALGAGPGRRAPRDNVLYDLGLFTGALGRERTFVVTPRGMGFEIPTGLFGVTPLAYEPGDLSALSSRVAPICTALRAALERLGPK